MPSFLRDLRRKSKSFRHDSKPPPPAATPLPASTTTAADQITKAPTNSSSSTPADLPRSKSTSTLNSTYDNSNSSSSSKPPSDRGSQSNLRVPSLASTPTPPVPGRPPLNSNNKRYSIISGAGSPTATERLSSPYAPRVLSISNNTWVNQKVLLIFGQIGDPTHKLLDGTLVVNHHADGVAPTNWEVCDSHFKALVYLQPGPNRIRLDFYSPKISQSNTSIPAHCSHININYLPVTSSPPLHLAIILAKDSPAVYDAVPARVEREGNGLETAKRKYRMAAYLWQAFTGEQMNRQGLGRRCFRLEEEWQPGTLSLRDFDSGTMRSEAKIHVIRCDKTLEELRDLEIAQQHEPAKRKGDLFGIAGDAVRRHFDVQPGQTRYVAALFLDTHWDTEVKTIRAHAALGGGDGTLQLGIFGSHALQSYPAALEEVVPAFTDCTPTDTAFVANDCSESGSSWEAVNIGIGAHLHEVGHLFGCPHQTYGVMARDYTRLNRTFTVREPYSTRTKSQGQRPCLPADECAWHPLDCLRFRFHAAFAQPNDASYHHHSPHSDVGVRVWTVENGAVLAVAPSGIAWIEMRADGESECRAWIDYATPESPDATKEGLPRQLTLSLDDLRARLQQSRRNSTANGTSKTDSKAPEIRRIQLQIFSSAGGHLVIEDFAVLANPKLSRTKLPDGRSGFRGAKLGYSQLPKSQPQRLIFESCAAESKSSAKAPKTMTAVRVFPGVSGIESLEFVYEDGSAQLFGRRDPEKLVAHEFALDARRGEVLMGFYVRAGLWIDGVQILTSLGRRSEVFGNAEGGSGHTLIPPRGYHVVGLEGTCAEWLDGLQLIIAR